jgi:hypothetical protein
MRYRLMIIIISLPLLAQAHWIDHSRSPQQIKRGALRMCGGMQNPYVYDKMFKELDERSVKHHFNFMYSWHDLSESYGWEGARDLAIKLKDKGILRSLYLDATSIYPTNDIYLIHKDIVNPKYNLSNMHENTKFRMIWRLNTHQVFPDMKKATVRGPDGNFKVFNYQDRYRGNVATPEWANHLIGNMEWIHKGSAGLKDVFPYHYKQYYKREPYYFDSYYWDNFNFTISYDKYSMGLWKSYSEQKLGRYVSNPEASMDPKVKGAWFEFWLGHHYKFLRRLKDHHDRLGKLMIMNDKNFHETSFQLYMANRGIQDMICPEYTRSHPPVPSRYFDYKRSLAATHGKAISIMCHKRPPTESKFRQQGISEAAACAGDYFVQNNHMFGVDSTIVQQYNGFRAKNEDLYYNAQPGGRVAMLYSITSTLREDKSPGMRDLADILVRKGLAFEVIVEDDLDDPDILKEMRIGVLLLPDVFCLSDSRLRMIIDFAKAGGTVIAAGDFASRNEKGIFRNREGIKKYLPGCEQVFGFNVTQDIGYQGMELEKPGKIRVSSLVPKGWAGLKFPGPEGKYKVTANYIDEDDGVSSAAVSRNDRTIQEWKLDLDDNESHGREVLTELDTGDVLKFHGTRNRGEMVRFTGFTIVSDEAGPEDLSTVKLGAGFLMYAPYSFWLMDESIIDKLVPICSKEFHFEAEDYEGKVFVNLLYNENRSILQAHIVNYHTNPEKTKLRTIDAPIELFFSKNMIGENSKAIMITPDGIDAETVPLKATKDGYTLTIPGVSVYKVICISKDIKQLKKLKVRNTVN